MAKLYRPQHNMTKQERAQVASAVSDLQSQKQHLMVLLAASLPPSGEQRFTVDELTKLQATFSSGTKTLHFSTVEGVVTVKLA